MKLHCILILILSSFFAGDALAQARIPDKEDTLRGSNHAYRSWWDVVSYDLAVQPDLANKRISGQNTIRYRVVSDSLPFVMQLDLQAPMTVESMLYDGGTPLTYRQEGSRYMIQLSGQQKQAIHAITVKFSGKPHVAKNPPWDGGWIWTKDSLGNPWASVACQGIGASIWYPCKDLQSDEPDSCDLRMTVPDTLVAVGNGRLRSVSRSKGLASYAWHVSNPINSYNIVPYIGKYVQLRDSFAGEKGNLVTDYWTLAYHRAKVASHLKPNVTSMLKCFEHWFGPYPFYEDSYKLVEAPFLGMEHQSDIAYGNNFMNGYLGRDLSRTGWGLKWDFIVVHESGHEWFGNNITASDMADNWIHEGFTSYSEVLYTECEYGKPAGDAYAQGVRKSIANDVPMIGAYGVRMEGSGDIYNKGSNVVHMIRQVMNDDAAFRKLLRNLNAQFCHRTVSTAELEAWICREAGIDFRPLFDQYLRTTQVPRLEYKLAKGKLSFRYVNCIPAFNMPLKIVAGKEILIRPTTQWQSIPVEAGLKQVTPDPNVYVELLKK